MATATTATEHLRKQSQREASRNAERAVLAEKAKPRRKPTAGQRIVRDLKKFSDDLAAGKDPEVTTVRVTTEKRRLSDALREERGQRKVSATQPGADMSPRLPKEPDTTTYNGRVAKRIRELRNARGLSVAEMMDRLADYGVTVNRSLVYDWENGSKLIHPNNYPALAKVLGCKTVRGFLPAE